MSSIQKIAVLVNESARQGRGGGLWKKAEAGVLAFLPMDTIVQRFQPPFDTEAWVRKVSEEDVNCFISAGGDGSVNFLLNALLNAKKTAAKTCFIGGIGLGSSNDFLKPYGRKLAGLHVRLDAQTSRMSDVAHVVFKQETGPIIQRIFIVNSGLGVTAAANYRFNNAGFVLKILKRYWTDGAIFWVALRSILASSNLPVHLIRDNAELDVVLSNIAVLKNPHVSGNFKYDQKIEPDDGLLGLNYCENMNTLELIHTLSDLSRDIFSGRPKRVSLTAKRIEIYTEHYTPLEMDGEVFLAKDICFSVLPAVIHVLGHGYSSPLNTA